MPQPCAHIAATALLALQHRGQEGAGIAYFAGDTDDSISCHKNVGLVSEVFDNKFLASAPETKSAVGHVRYSTTGSNTPENTQPIVTHHSRLTFAVCHNGNITNADALRGSMVNERGAVFYTTNDTEIISKIIIDQMIKTGNIEKSVLALMDIIEGAYSLVIMTRDKLIVARDPNGFRPLCVGRLGTSVVAASETCAFDVLGAEFVRDVEPGEIVTIDKQGIRSRDYSMYKRHEMCSMEYIYFARPDSDIDGCNVHAYRKESGRLLWKEAPAEADIVVGVPDSSLSAAMGYAEASGLPYEMGLIKNKYIGRTFIQPSQELREKGVRMKLSAVRSIVRGKRVVLVDDSIVRGTTSRRIVTMLKEAGATEVHVRIASPPMTDPCFYGVDTSTREELISARKNTAGVCEEIGADSLVFLSPESLLKAGSRKELCMACFTGQYPTALYQSPEEANKDVKC